MATEKIRFETPEQYIDSFPAAIQKILKQVRATLQKAVPDAEEVISYNIPAFKKEGGWIFYYSAYKNHFSLSCPPPFTVFEEFKNELAGYELSKSTIQFPYEKGVPVKLISDMAKYRAKQQAAAPKKGKK